jgi:molybdenum cofactor guanylyltransferase
VENATREIGGGIRDESAGGALIFSAVVLAGGRSSRMGCDKSALDYHGRSLLTHQIDTLKKLKPQQLFISGRAGRNDASFGLPVLHDRHPDAGPLGGVEQALASCTTSLLLVLAVDMPHMTAVFLRTLLGRCRHGSGAVPILQSRYEPLAAVYPKAAHALAEEMLRAGRRAMSEFVQACATAALVNPMPCSPAESAAFENWNSPGDLPEPLSRNSTLRLRPSALSSISDPKQSRTKAEDERGPRPESPSLPETGDLRS